MWTLPAAEGAASGAGPSPQAPPPASRARSGGVPRETTFRKWPTRSLSGGRPRQILFATAAPAQACPVKTRADVDNRTSSVGSCRAPSSGPPTLFRLCLPLSLPCGTDTETKYSILWRGSGRESCKGLLREPLRKGPKTARLGLTWVLLASVFACFVRGN